MIRVGIIGLGKIALEYQIENQSTLYLTHMSILFSNPKFQVVFGIDSNVSKREKFNHIYKIPAFEPYNQEIYKYEIDMVVIATPAEAHLKNIEFVKTLKPKLVLLEKPLAGNIKDAKLLLKEASSLDVFVNYQRNYHQKLIEVKDNLLSQVKNGRISIIGCFTGDWLNSGSHMISLIQFLLGDELEVDHLLSQQENFLKIKSKSSDIYIVRLNESKASIFRFSIFCPDVQIDYDSTSDYIRYYELKHSEIFLNERILKESHAIRLNEPEALIYTYTNIISYFEGKHYVFTDLESSYKIMQLILER